MAITPKKKRLSLPRGNQVHFVSLGCPRNLVDTEVMLGILLKNGYEPANEMSSADFIIINTCGFLTESREESLDFIQEALDGKKAGCRLIVTGCMVQKHKREIEENCPGVDYFLGPGDVESILKVVENSQEDLLLGSAKSYLEVGEVPRQISTPSHYAYLKIAEGCRKRCSYCIIPDIKGPLKSKTPERVVKDFRALLKKDVREIILIAQDLGDFGRDRGFRGSLGLVELLKTLSEESGDFWLRLLYLYPDEISGALVEVMAKDPRICPYLDVPIQHINDEVLKSMRRKTTSREIYRSIRMLRKAIPDISIRTSLIVGFPGETEEQFLELVDFVREEPLDNVGVFAYSNEEGSHASTLPRHLPQAVIDERYNHLMEVQGQVLEKYLEKWVGRHLDVVVEGYHPDSEYLLRGRHRGQCPDIDGSVILNDWEGVETFGMVYPVEITGVAGYDLIGRVC